MAKENIFKVGIYVEPGKRIGEQVGNYRLTSWLGRGAFADVYLGEHIYLKTQSAIKMLHVQMSEKALKDFLNEACTIAQLGHPNIVHVLDYGDEKGSPFLVMTYAPNGSLGQRFPEGTRVSLQQIIPVVQQIASALDYAHQRSLIHRDVKPENMLLGPQDQVLLSDFGFALMAQGKHTQAANGTPGTVLYMAPEQLEGKVHFASDQYALGVVTYQWLSGQCPFTGSYIQVGMQHLLAPPPSLCGKVPDLPPAVESVVFKALAKDRTERYESVTDFANALQDVYKGASSVNMNAMELQSSSPVLERVLETDEIATLPEPIQPTQPQHRGNIWQTALVLLAVFSVIAAGVRLWYNITYLSASTHYATPALLKDNSTGTVRPGTSSSVPSTSSVPLSALTPTVIPTSGASYEAEASDNTVTGGAKAISCSGCSGGKKVEYIGLQKNGAIGTLQFNNINEYISGNYQLTIYCIDGYSYNLTGYISVNGGAGMAFTTSSTGDWNTSGAVKMVISLNAGNNTIEFYNSSGLVPDMDRIIV